MALKTVEWTIQEAERLKESYEKAVKRGSDTFHFKLKDEEHLLIPEYAYFLLEYLSDALQVEDLRPTTKIRKNN